MNPRNESYRDCDGFWEPTIGELVEIETNKYGIYLGRYEQILSDAICETLFRVYVQNEMHEEIFSSRCLKKVF